MRGYAVMAVVLSACGLLAGCFEGKADMTFNPDGTGKMVGEITFPMEPPWQPAPKTGDELKTPEEQMKAVVTNIVKKSTGIDAWRDVSFEQVLGNRVHFKGTAYFKEASKVKFFPDTRPRVGFGGEGQDATMLILTRATEKPPEAPVKFKAMSSDEATKAMKDSRDLYKKLRPGFEEQVKGLKFDFVFRMPGVIGEVHGLKMQDDTLTASIDGNRILHAIDALLDDNAYLKEFLAESGQISSKWASDEMRQRLYVNKGEVWAKVGEPLHPQFDYKAESEAAKKAMPDMMVKLGLDVPPATKPATTPTTAKTPTAPAKTSTAPAKTSTAPAKTPTTSTTKAPADSVPKMPTMPDMPPSIPAPILPF